MLAQSAIQQIGELFGEDVACLVGGALIVLLLAAAGFGVFTLGAAVVGDLLDRSAEQDRPDATDEQRDDSAEG